MRKLNISLEKLHELKQSGYDFKVKTKSGELTEVLDTVMKPKRDVVKVTFENDLTRTVAETHRFSFNGKEVYAKDAIEVDMLDGSKLKVVEKEFIEESKDVYDIMIPDPHWYVDQHNMIHHNTGKSLGLCTLASQYILQGYNVLYISMEMDEESVSKRIDANLLDISMDELKNTSYKTFGSKLETIKAKCMGSLRVKQYPTSNAGVLEFTALLNELQLKQGWKPDIIMNDYLGITKSKRVASSDNTYTYQKIVSEELRGFATEYGVPVWSAVQTNRDAWGASDISMANIADSAAVAATADFLIGIIETEELILAQQQLLKAVKNRYGSKDVAPITIRVDKDKQRWMDVVSSETMPGGEYKVSDEVMEMTPKGKKLNMDPTAEVDVNEINWGL